MLKTILYMSTQQKELCVCENIFHLLARYAHAWPNYLQILV